MRAMTDQDLILQTSAARGRAHRAPFAEWSKDHEGHSAIVNHTSAWADHGRQWTELAAEVERRGLKQPPCDCPLGTHEVQKAEPGFKAAHPSGESGPAVTQDCPGSVTANG